MLKRAPMLLAFTYYGTTLYQPFPSYFDSAAPLSSMTRSDYAPCLGSIRFPVFKRYVFAPVPYASMQYKIPQFSEDQRCFHARILSSHALPTPYENTQNFLVHMRVCVEISSTLICYVLFRR